MIELSIAFYIGVGLGISECVRLGFDPGQKIPVGHYLIYFLCWPYMLYKIQKKRSKNHADDNTTAK